MAGNTVPSINDPAIDRYRRWTPTWYPWIKKAFERLIETEEGVADAAVSITEINTVVDDIKAQWGIQVNAGNRVVGQIRLDGTQSESAFSVLADKFIIVHPSVDGTTIQAFITGLVNGVATVGINGALVVDGTITATKIAAGAVTAAKIEAGAVTATKISVSTLSAVAANLGTVTAGRIQNSGNTSFWDLSTGAFQITA